jgi:hypothetical protein
LEHHASLADDIYAGRLIVLGGHEDMMRLRSSALGQAGMLRLTG